MKEWNEYWKGKLDQSIIVYDVRDGRVFGGSDPNRTVKQVQKESYGNVPACDYTMELDLSNRSLVMEVDSQKILIDSKLLILYW